MLLSVYLLGDTFSIIQIPRIKTSNDLKSTKNCNCMTLCKKYIIKMTSITIFLIGQDCRGYHFVHIWRVKVCTRWFSNGKGCPVFKSLPPYHRLYSFRKQLHRWVRSCQKCLIFIKRRPSKKNRLSETQRC